MSSRGHVCWFMFGRGLMCCRKMCAHTRASGGAIEVLGVQWSGWMIRVDDCLSLYGEKL